MKSSRQIVPCPRGNPRTLYALAIFLLMFVSHSAAQPKPAARSKPIDDLRAGFVSPPDDSRIMMRWWWFGPAVTNAELERELRTMKQAGIGGVEVQAVYPLALDDPSSGLKNLPYLSDDFLNALRFTSNKTTELGLRMDLTMGSGWPYGGATVPISEAAGMLRIERIKSVVANQRVPLPHVSEGERLMAAFVGPAQPDAATLASFKRLDMSSGEVTVPSGVSGPHQLIFYIASRTGQQVKRAAVGAEGFVVDHYDASAVDHYIRNVGDRLMQGFDRNRPFAVFCDSLEVYNSDWTGDFLQQFQKRRGYDLLPLLPALSDDLGPTSQQVRFDWARTLTDLFNDHFSAPLHAWTKQNGTRLRMQAYGIPPAELSSYALVDLPEGEGAQWKQLSATRWASSASHLYGVPVTSSETWTWLHSPVFRATPLDMKAEADLHFLIGINQLVGHGWPYTAPGVENPGWRFYAAAVFDEKNPWFIAMPDIARYLQRVSYLLRQGSPANDVAVYLPTSDALASMRPGRVNLFETLRDQIGTELLPQLLGAGFGLDFFDDDALRNVGRIDRDILALGPNRYHAIILPGVERIPLDTYRKIRQFAEQGGIVIASRRKPDSAPGLQSKPEDSSEIRDISQRLFANNPARVRFVPDEHQLGAELSTALTPDVVMSPASPELGFVHRHTSSSEIYFIANTSNTRQQTTATFRTSARAAEWWDALTGNTHPARIRSGHDSPSVALDLAPYESRILIFSNQLTPASPSKASGNAVQPMDLSTGWTLKFADGLVEDLDRLRSWTDDDRTRYFSGTATYERTISIPAATLRSAALILNFGDGTPLPPQRLKSGTQAWLDSPVREAAIVYINDQRAGSVWCSPFEIDISKFLRGGENRIRVQVANLAVNNMAAHRLPDYRLLNLRYGVRFEAQDMDKIQPVPSGLFGPIRLITKPRD